MLLAVRRHPTCWATKILLCGGLLWCPLGYNFLGTTTHRTPIPVAAAAEDQADETLDLDITAPPASEECWAYTHLQKAGGTTIKNLLFDFWGPEKSTTYDSYQWKKGQGYADSAAASLASPTGLNAVAGGYPEALRNTPALGGGNDGSSCRWFTVFRHPVSRLVSAFYYCREDPSDQLCASDVVSSRDVDLATFARHWGNYAVRQFVLGLVSPDDVKDYLVSSPAGVGGATLSENEVEKMPGWYMFKLFLHGRSRSAVGLEESIDGYHGEGGEVHDHDDEAALREMLVPVQELLRGRYAAVGILEEWGPTLSLFNAALGVPGMDWHERFESTGKLNVDVRFEGQKRDALEMAMTDAEIKRHLWLDLLLYEHALDVFHEQRQLHGIV